MGDERLIETTKTDQLGMLQAVLRKLKKLKKIKVGIYEKIR